MRRQYTFIDLFAAPGGLSLGFEMAGFHSLAGIDADPKGMLTYEANFPKSRCLIADIHYVDKSWIKEKTGVHRGEVDVIIGGPPCQGFSTIGRVKIASLARMGVWNLNNNHPRFIEDPRNALYREFIRIVRALEPKIIVMENVPGMMSYRNGEIVQEIRDDFKRIGYKTEAKVLNAVWFGVPQVKKRIFFIGTKLKGAEIVWPEPKYAELGDERVSGENHAVEWKKLRSPITVWEAIGDLPEPIQGKQSLADQEIEYDKKPFSDYQKWAQKGSSKVHNHITRQHSERDIIAFNAMKEGKWWRDLPEKIKKLYGYRDDIFHDKMKRLRSDRPSWTVVAHLCKDGYMYIHPKQPRSITVREAARLQSFPDRFIFRGSRTDQFKQVGNAVPPLLARAVAESVRRMLKAAE